MTVRGFTTRTAIAVVIANMIGTGVFTSLGFQLLEIDSGFALLSLWVLGGITALSGALSYAELGAAIPRSGGEYRFLAEIYHPAAGFVSGWVSASIGFAAPVALAAMTFAAYINASLPYFGEPLPEKPIAVTLIVVLAILHTLSHRSSGITQGLFTSLKVLLILVFCIAAITLTKQLQPISFAYARTDNAVLLSGSFAVALIYVNYAYTGWNAATYFSGELSKPTKTLPRVLLTGTAVVTLIYVALNAVFLKVAPADAMRGELEIGFIVARYAFGDIWAQYTGLILAALLISTVSAMTLAGPRVLSAIGRDYRLFRVLGHTGASGLPWIAIAIQSALAIVFVMTASFEAILVFSGFILGLNSLATVLALYVDRWRYPHRDRPFTVPAYPFTPAVYVLLMSFTLLYTGLQRPQEAGFALLIIITGLLVYAASAAKERRKQLKE